MVLVASGMVRFETRGRKKLFALNRDLVAQWRTLNPTEQYATLLEVWWFRADGDMIGIPSIANNLLYEFRMIFTTFQRKMQHVSYNRLAMLALMELFEFVQVRTGEQVLKRWNVEGIVVDDLADTLIKLIYPHEEEILLKTGLGHLYPILQPHMNDLKQTLLYPEKKFTEGLFCFRIRLQRAVVWMEVDAANFLDTLAHEILSAFDFSNDHLYYFEYRDSSNRSHRIVHEHLQSGLDEPFADEIKVGDLDIVQGSELLFVFDLGDYWEFEIVLEQIDPERKITGVHVLKRQGEPPEQYRFDDEDMWEEEDFE
jgi:hypothetical protein